MRLVFMGTPDFAVPPLERLVALGHSIELVVTQPDRPAGRGRRVVAPSVKEAALAHGLKVIQPRRVREAEALASLADARPDAIIVVAFGQILPRQVLAIPPRGCLNVHASLLPRHRGASPISAAILAGDDATGVTIMLLDEGMDTGPILTQRRAPILPEDTTGSLAQRLAALGADLLAETLPAWENGTLTPRPQDPALATYAPQLRKEEGLLDWQSSAEALWRRVRAFSPWPGTFTRWEGRLLKVTQCAPLAATQRGALPGTVDLWPADRARAEALYPHLLPETGRVLTVSCQSGMLALLRVQVEGGRPVTGAEFVAGHRAIVGARLG